MLKRFSPSLFLQYNKIKFNTAMALSKLRFIITMAENKYQASSFNIVQYIKLKISGVVL